ncbi:MAG TPA: hypothetical protein VGL94_21790 [Ktedonobacteraceae bacterium]|jgi:hypothetical protein
MKTNENVMEVLVPTKIDTFALEGPKSSALPRHRAGVLRSPIWLCLLLALCVRVWLVIHTHGFMDGDEALLGVQAQHILQGERPIYYYGQPYMGSLEAYFVAIVFALTGSALWALRIVPIVLSLVVVWLTWCLAGALADGAKLSSTTRRWFMTVAALLATLPPLYDMVMELRTWGGHIEIYIIMLLLLYAVLRLTQRWDVGASGREMAVRWAVIGFIIGVGIWIYPLGASAVLAMLVWVGVFFLRRVIPHFRRGAEDLSLHIRNLLLAVIALPTCLVGFAPGLYWGANNQWANILYLFAPGSDSGTTFLKQHPDRLVVLGGTAQLYLRCIVPEVIGGSLPSEPITSSSIASFQMLNIIGIASIIIVAGLLITSFLFRRHPLLTSIQPLSALPLLFASSTIFTFCFSSAVGGSVLQPCTRDGVGRYAAPILLALPFIGATLCTSIILYFQNRRLQSLAREMMDEPILPVSSRRRFRIPANLGLNILAVLLVIYLAAVSNTYVKSDSGYVFQSFACLYAPSDNEPIIAYMQHEHIHYAWGTITLGNPIMFETHSEIIVSDPRIFTLGALDRLPQNAMVVEHADRASLLDMVQSTDHYPATLKALDQADVKYRVARFPTEPGNMDVLVITPLSRTLKPSEASSLGSWKLLC